MPIERDTNGRFKRSTPRAVTSAPVTTTPGPATTLFSNNRMPVTYHYSTEKLPFYDYRPVLARVTMSGIISIHTWPERVTQASYNKYIGAQVKIFSCAVRDDSVYIDLNLLPDNAWNDETGSWNPETCLGELPCFIPVKVMLYDGTHPLIRSMYYDPSYYEFKWHKSNSQTIYNHSLWLRDVYNKRNVQYPAGVKAKFMTDESTGEIILANDNYASNAAFRFCKGRAARTVYNTEKFQEFFDLCKWYQSYLSMDYLGDCVSYLNVLRTMTSQINGRAHCTNMLEIPNISETEKLSLIREANPVSQHQNGYCTSYPMLSEFEDPGEMMQILTEHLSRVPDLKITYLRKRHVYFHGGNGHPDGLNYKHSPSRGREQTAIPVYMSKLPEKLGKHESITIGEVDSGSERLMSSSAILYIGEAWMVYFTIEGKDVLAGNHLYCITPEQYAACYANHPIHGNKYMVDETGKPIALPDVTYLAQSNWCERADGAFSDDTTDFQTPYHRRMPLFVWVLTNLIQKTKIVFKGIGTPTVSPVDKLKKLNTFIDNSGITAVTRDLQALTPDQLEGMRNGQMPEVQSVAEPVPDPWHVDPQFVIDMSQPVASRQPTVRTNNEGTDTVDAASLLRPVPGANPTGANTVNPVRRPRTSRTANPYVSTANVLGTEVLLPSLDDEE